MQIAGVAMSLRTSLIGIIIMLVLSLATANQDKPPERPEVFHSPEELRAYLKELNEYFAIVGRPRFGRKRSLSTMPRQRLSFATLAEMDTNDDGVISLTEYELYSLYFGL